VTLVERQTASPVMVVAATMYASPEKLGPPESPWQVPPLPVAGYMEMRSQAELIVISVPPGGLGLAGGFSGAC
jgi:hypothetical protein